MNRPPRKKVTVVIERGEEGDSQATVCQGIQQTMAGGRQKEIHPHGGIGQVRAGPAETLWRTQRLQKRVGESAVAPEVSVTDAEPESDHIEVGSGIMEQTAPTTQT